MWANIAAGVFVGSALVLLFCAAALLSLVSSRRYRSDPTRPSRGSVQLPYLRRVK